MKSRVQLINELVATRQKLEAVFAPDTANAVYVNMPASTGHCAAVARIVSSIFGGKMVSAKVDGQSHWFNRIECPDGILDFDLTGDQFGKTSIQVSSAGMLYPETRERHSNEINESTERRAQLLAERAGLSL